MRLVEFLAPLYEGAKLSRKDVTNILAWFRMGFEVEFYYERGANHYRFKRVRLKDWDKLLDLIELKGGSALLEVARSLIHNWDQFVQEYNSHQNLGLQPINLDMLGNIKRGERARDLPYLMLILDRLDMMGLSHALLRIKGSEWVLNNFRYSFRHAVQQDEDGHYITVFPPQREIFGKLAQDFQEQFGVKLYQEREYAKIPGHQSAVWRVMADSTVDDSDNPRGGAEISSPAMDMQEGLEWLEKMFRFIDRTGYTNSNTGLHIRVSFKQPKQLEDIDWFKVALFMGDERVLSDFDRRKSTYTQTPLDRIRQYFRDQIAKIGGESSRAIARIIRQDRFTKLVQPMRDMFTQEAEKYSTFNISGFRDHQGRIEFRVWGNDKYERRFDEIKRTLFQFCFAVILGASPDLHVDTYMKKIFNLIRPEQDVEQDRWGEEFTRDEKQVISRLPGWIQQRILNVLRSSGYWVNKYAVRAIIGLLRFGMNADKQFRKKLTQAGIQIVMKKIKDIDNNPAHALEPVVTNYDKMPEPILQGLLNTLRVYPETYKMLRNYIAYREKIKPIIPQIDQYTRKSGIALTMIQQFFGARKIDQILAAVSSDLHDAYQESKLQVKPKVIFDLIWEYLQALYVNNPQEAQQKFRAFSDYMAWAK